MAQEAQRIFDTQLGAVILIIRDEFGHDSFHTIHLTSDDVSVDAERDRLIQEADARTAALKARMQKNGWQSQPG